MKPFTLFLMLIIPCALWIVIFFLGFKLLVKITGWLL